jgi:CRISPR system Cascade subunit CasE
MPDHELYLTRLTPDPAHPLARRERADAGAMHRRVMSLFPDRLSPQPRATAGALFRVDQDTTGIYVLIQSSLPPDPTKLPTGYGPSITKNMAPLMARCQPGTRVTYRIIGNATARLGPRTTAGRPGQTVPLRGRDAHAWWQRHAATAGLDLDTIHTTVLAPGSTAGGDGEATRRTPHDRTQFDGTATITDATALITALSRGIGRAKSYGCGLLTVAPLP